ncbi:MAG: AAA family ATPase [Chloroflexi bacterium]|nr:MAG: AAA family ATPase [Chloroflexota bacterium]
MDDKKQAIEKSINLQLDESKVPEFVRLVRNMYEGWDSFSYTPFQKDEVVYKRNAVQKAHALLSEAALSELLDAGNYEEIIRRVREVARASNLMYLSHPRSGDLKLLNVPNLDEAVFCTEFFALLYDSEPVSVRLDRFFSYVQRQGLTPKWTFPTYYLFLIYPNSEMYIKPMMTRWYIELMNGPRTYPWTPSGQAYEAVQSICQQLQKSLSKFEPQDMVDVHSMLWTAYQAAEKEANRSLAEPFNSMFVDIAEAEWAFDLMADLVEKVGGFGPDDPRFALTMAEGHIRINFGNWMALDFPPERIRITLLKKLGDSVKPISVWGKFANSKEDTAVHVYPRTVFRAPEPTLQKAYEASCLYMRKRFRKWKGTPFRHAHISEIFNAVFDSDLREKLLLEGLREPAPSQVSELIEGPEEDFIDQPDEVVDYDRSSFLNETYLLENTLDELLDMLEDKPQLIFYGPPGTGKTFVARALAKHLTCQAAPPPEQVEIVQFHPAYGYEEFIEGIRPESKAIGNGLHQIDYPTKAGVFRAFCEGAAKRPDQKHVFIIDEVNRGNIARIFGELMLLLEYRDEDVRLPYSGNRFSIPANVILIGTMNTADRSIALVDFALRRRFHFFRFGANPDLLDRWLEKNQESISYLSSLYRKLTEESIDDPAFQIGPSYFMRPGLTESQLRGIWQRSIVPYLAEYYVENPSRVERWHWDSSDVMAIRNGAH